MRCLDGNLARGLLTSLLFGLGEGTLVRIHRFSVLRLTIRRVITVSAIVITIVVVTFANVIIIVTFFMVIITIDIAAYLRLHAMLFSGRYMFWHIIFN